MPIFLTGHSEKRAPPQAFLGLDTTKLLYHQVRTPLALRDHDLVVNTYNTGTGKTRAALMRLLEPGMRRDVLFIAPTNALIGQHVADIRQFVEDHGLDYEVLHVDAAHVRALPARDQLRPGEKLQRLILNFREYLPDSANLRKRPMVMVVNPDIFYYALFFQYQPADQRNLFEQLMGSFNYVVIDEFHYYDNKQLVAFLFFCILSKEWGYFAQRGRKVCLLSATPNNALRTFLDRIFGQRWAEVSPDNEPTESAGYAQVATLAPLELELADASLPDWAAQNYARIDQWRQAGLEGALISSSLARVNQTWDVLKPLERRRITGPEPESERLRAGQSPLILATPTVDIGYNFERPNKDRQPIDFVVFDARFNDEAIQRLGRAGRVLGRMVADQPSRAVALLSTDALAALRAYEGQTLSRPAFNALLRGLESLPPKHTLSRYISSCGIAEAFYPIWQYAKLGLPDERKAVLEQLYTAIRDTFAPQAKQPYDRLERMFKKYERYIRFREDDRKGDALRTWGADKLAALLGDLVYWHSQGTAQPQVKVTPQHVPALLRGQAMPERLRRFVNEQHALTKALFNFRDAFAGAEAELYDEGRLLSSEQRNRYDLLHLIANYELEVLEDRAALAQLCDCATDAISVADAYVRLIRRRTPRWNVSLWFDTAQSMPEITPDMFAQLYTCKPVALRGLVLRYALGRETPQPLPDTLAQAIAEQYVPLFAVPERQAGPLLSLLRQSPLVARGLTVSFPDGSSEPYLAVLGTGALHVEAERGRQLRFRKQNEEEHDSCIIL